MEAGDTYMSMKNLTPELREKLSRFLEIERWHRALLSAYATPPESVTRRCWDAAFREIPLTPEEKRIYEDFKVTAAAVSH
jgi:hypothetical protein